jgi:membrane protease YdiL (CAAX protease family)
VNESLKAAGRRAGLGAASLAVAVLLLVALRVVARARIPDPLLLDAAAVLMAAAYLGGALWIERRRPTELARAGLAAELAGGLGLGIVLFSAVIGALWAAGAYHSHGWGTAAALGSGAVAALAEAVIEEVLFRGYLFRLVAVMAGTWWALLITSALFGAAHAFNPGATVASTAAVAAEAGVLLGAAYALTGRLWLPIGLHAAWNFTEANVFGLTVSGLAAPKALVEGELHGAAVLTGGAFGPEASVVAVAVCVAAALVLLRRLVRYGRVQRPAWSRT